LRTQGVNPVNQTGTRQTVTPVVFAIYAAGDFPNKRLKLNTMKCFNCGSELQESNCKRCNAVQHFNYSGVLIFGPALVILLITASGCALQKYGYRQHRNKVAQKVIQYEHCDPLRAHANAQYRHFSERPKSHWPLND
jgi:hypothetical protein